METMEKRRAWWGVRSLPARFFETTLHPSKSRFRRWSAGSESGRSSTALTRMQPPATDAARLWLPRHANRPGLLPERRNRQNDVTYGAIQQIEKRTQGRHHSEPRDHLDIIDVGRLAVCLLMPAINRQVVGGLQIGPQRHG